MSRSRRKNAATRAPGKSTAGLPRLQSGKSFPRLPARQPTVADWVRLALAGGALLVWIVVLAILAFTTGRWG
jgi:hypothetical protein